MDYLPLMILHKHSRPHCVSEHCFSQALKFHIFRSVHDGIALYALESPHMCSILSLRSFPNATFEFETVEATVETMLGVRLGFFLYQAVQVKLDWCVITQPMYQAVQVKLDACVIPQPMYQAVHVKMDLCVIPQPVHQAVQVKLDACVITQPTSCVQLHNLSLVCNYTTYLLCVITQPISCM